MVTEMKSEKEMLYSENTGMSEMDFHRRWWLFNHRICHEMTTFYERRSFRQNAETVTFYPSVPLFMIIKGREHRFYA